MVLAARFAAVRRIVRRVKVVVSGAFLIAVTALARRGLAAVLIARLLCVGHSIVLFFVNSKL